MVISVFIDELPLPDGARAELLRLQRDESGNCAVLLRLLRGLGVEPSKPWGASSRRRSPCGAYGRGWSPHRGQSWVARRIAAARPRIQDAEVRNAMRSMRDSHFANIRSLRGSAAGDLPPA